jgi:hypothetical protein
MTKINWALEQAKDFLKSKGYELQHTIGSINYTCYVFKGTNNGKRIEIWDDKSGEMYVVDVNNRSVDLEKL